MANRPDRPIISQKFLAQAFTVGVTPTPLSALSQQDAMGFLYTSIVVCVAAGSATNVWWGDSTVSQANRNGIEIVAGTSKTFAINPRPQLYELQEPILQIPNCTVAPLAIPFVVWDTSQVFLVTNAAPLVVGLVLFPEMFK